MTDYWLSKLFFDMQDRSLAAAYRADPATVMDRYPLGAEARRALLAVDVPALAARVNPYLLRYFFTAAGMSDAEFLQRIRQASAPAARG